MYIFHVTKLSCVSLGSLSADTTAEYEEAMSGDEVREGVERLEEEEKEADDSERIGA